MSGITTHVLDTSRGRPGAGVGVMLERRRAGEWMPVARATTDADGRARLLDAAEPGVYRITFDTGSYFPETFFPEAAVAFEVRDAAQHHHVPLLVSPFGYSTYRGS